MSTPLYTTDTATEAEDVQLALFKQMTPQQRLQKVSALSTELRNMSFAAIRRRYPDDPEAEIRLRFIALTYGENLADDVRRFLQERES